MAPHYQILGHHAHTFQLPFNKQRVSNTRLILLGDTLCDRGNSDYMTLLLYLYMVCNRVNFTIILSNHDLGFIKQMEMLALNRDRYVTMYKTRNDLPTIVPHHSFDIPDLCAEQAKIASNIYNNVYKSKLKVIECEHADDKTIIYSHAPCDLAATVTISPIQSIQIDDIVKGANEINNLKNLLTGYCNNPLDSNPLSYFVWNRDPKTFYGNHLNVYGHVGSDPHAYDQPGIKKITIENYINLDSNFGRHPEYGGHQNDNGTYNYKPDPYETVPDALKILQVVTPHKVAEKEVHTQNNQIFIC